MSRSTPELTDGVLRLRAHLPQDVEGVQAQYCDERAVRWMRFPSPYSRKHAEHFVHREAPDGWRRGDALNWAIADASTDDFLGTIDVRVHGRTGTVGYALHPAARGRGHATRALRLVVEHAFAAGGLDLDLLRWESEAGNWASRRIAWRVGFRFDGTRPRAEVARDGRYVDAWAASLARDEPREPTSRWIEPLVLRTEGLVLRPWRDDDVDAVVQACSDPVSQHWLGALPSPYTAGDARRFLDSTRERHAGGGGLHLAAALDEGGPAVGSFTVFGLGVRDGGGELGYWVHPAARGRGVATAAARLITDHALGAAGDGGLGLRRVVVAHVEGNDASRSVIERSGFTRWGTERAGDRVRGGTVLDLHWYERLAP